MINPALDKEVTTLKLKVKYLQKQLDWERSLQKKLLFLLTILLTNIAYAFAFNLDDKIQFIIFSTLALGFGYLIIKRLVGIFWTKFKKD
jgi:hypothetical protein